MASSVVIRGPRPNNNPILVMVQNLDAEGNKDGDARLTEVLDDGEECFEQVEAGRRIVVLLEGKRGVTYAPPGDPVLAARAEEAIAAAEEAIPVIGHETAAHAAADPEPVG